MTEPSDHDALLLAKRELRHLKETIVALREQLEEGRRDQDSRVQEVRARAEDEIRQLQGTVARLREEMERIQQDGRNRLAEAQRDHRDELEQHRDTIRTLRERLEGRARGDDTPVAATSEAP